MYHQAKILGYIQNICQTHRDALSDQIHEVILWNVDVLEEQNMIEASDLSKIALALDLAIKSTNSTNRVAAMKLLNKFLVNFAEECHLEVVLSEETFRRLMRLLTESINQPAKTDLFQQSFKAVNNVLAIDSNAYLQMALNNDILDRLHAVIITEQANDIKEAVWALSNMAG